MAVVAAGGGGGGGGGGRWWWAAGAGLGERGLTERGGGEGDSNMKVENPRQAPAAGSGTVKAPCCHIGRKALGLGRLRGLAQGWQEMKRHR